MPDYDRLKREYPEQPIPGVGAVLIDGNKVLLVKRSHEPGKGLWSVPGGVIELGESAEDAVVREVKEETGLSIRVEKLLGLTDVIIRDPSMRVRFHYLLVSFLGSVIGGSLESAPDKSRVRWFTGDQLRSLDVTKTALDLLKKAGFRF